MPPRLPVRCSLRRTIAKRRHLRHFLYFSFLLFLSFLILHLTSSILRRANSLGRCCSPPSPPTFLSSSFPCSKIAIVTLSDESKESEIYYPGAWKRRSFVGVRNAVWGNKKTYAEKMGYGFVDATTLVDRSRPPNWSKILAIQSSLRFYDWVFWNDADTVITNLDVSLESILFGLIGHGDIQSSPDLVVTEDLNGVNSGVFFIRKSEWSQRFLEKWWNQTSFVQFGSTKSGDNAALSHLIDHLPQEELQRHVIISPMQCLFNSYPWYPSWKSYHLLLSPMKTWQGVYSDGDFMVHLAGLDNKSGWALKFLQNV
ncbi:alpha-1,2-galactosyltransferase gmh3-like [Carex rostrata]